MVGTCFTSSFHPLTPSALPQRSGNAIVLSSGLQIQHIRNAICSFSVDKISFLMRQTGLVKSIISIFTFFFPFLLISVVSFYVSLLHFLCLVLFYIFFPTATRIMSCKCANVKTIAVIGAVNWDPQSFAIRNETETLLNAILAWFVWREPLSACLLQSTSALARACSVAGISPARWAQHNVHLKLSYHRHVITWCLATWERWQSRKSLEDLNNNKMHPSTICSIITPNFPIPPNHRRNEGH